MSKIHIKFAIALGICLDACLPVLAGSQSKEKFYPIDELAFGHIRKMADGTFDENALKACEAFLNKAELYDRPRWLAVLARYQIIMENNPLAALAIVGPALIGEEKTRQWQTAQADAEQKEKAQRDKAVKTTQVKQLEPQRLLVPFPPVEEWSISPLNAECAVEAIHAYLVLKEYETAMAQISNLGPKLEQLSRVLAGECGGDLLMTMQRYDQSLRFYKYALEWLEDLRRAPLPVLTEAGEVREVRKASPRTSPQHIAPIRVVKGKTKPAELEMPEPETIETLYFRPFTSDEKYLQERMTESLDTATRLWDIEQYGEDFVLYREAERMRRELGRYLEAYLAYQETEEKYAGTMYGEAARAYRIKCLWALAEPENVEQTQKTIYITQVILNIKRKQQKAFGRIKISSDRVLFIRNMIAEYERKLEDMMKAPLGKAAAEAAGQETEEFITDNEFGLYRGEVMEAQADYCLDFLCDPVRADAWYNRALLWFDKAEKMNVDLDAFKVPEKSRDVSAPPPEMKAKDDWGNVGWSNLDGGKLFNQRTSKWYIPYHRMMAQTRKALCLFIIGKPDEALALLNIILDVDYAERINYEQGMPNSYSRLKAEFEQGRMFATTEELKSFTGKSRTAIIVADYYYEIEQWKEAAERYRRIDSEMRKELSLKARAYLDFMLGNCAMITENNGDKALKYFSKFITEYKNTPTWPRAMTAIFTVYQNKCEYDKALNTLKTICRRMPDTEWGQRAYYHQGEFLYSRGQKKKAQEIFETCLKRYTGTWLARGSGQYLEKIKTGQE